MAWLHAFGVAGRAHGHLNPSLRQPEKHTLRLDVPEGKVDDGIGRAVKGTVDEHAIPAGGLPQEHFLPAPELRQHSLPLLRQQPRRLTEADDAGGVLGTAAQVIFLLAAVLLCLSLGIYQAYITLSASLYVVYFIRQSMDAENSVGDILKKGAFCILSMALSLALYFAVNKLVMRFAVTEYNSYASAAMNTDLNSLLRGLRVAITAFFGYFYKGYYHLAPTKLSMLVHIAALLLSAAAAVLWLMNSADRGRKLLFLALLAVFPVSVNCIYIISSQRHTLMLLGFTSVYVLMLCLVERADIKWIKSALSVCLALILTCNIFYANRIYLKMKLEYEEAYSFYSGLISRVKSTEGYDADTMLIISGDAAEKNLVYHSDEIDTSDIVGLMEGLLNIYSRYDFIKYYVGYDYNPIDWDGWGELDKMDEVNKMPLYPYDGSVKKFGDFMVVHLG